MFHRLESKKERRASIKAAATLHLNPRFFKIMIIFWWIITWLLKQNIHNLIRMTARPMLETLKLNNERRRHNYSRNSCKNICISQATGLVTFLRQVLYKAVLILMNKNSH